jgi:hypothetical protein
LIVIILLKNINNNNNYYYYYKLGSDVLARPKFMGLVPLIIIKIIIFIIIIINLSYPSFYSF